MFIPGIECDIKIKNNEIKHFTISSLDIETIEKFNHSKELPICIDTFIERLNNLNKNLLLTAHFMKHEKRSFIKIEDISKIFDKIKSPYIHKVLDFSSKNRKFNAKNHLNEMYPSFCFSDVRDWTKYEEDVKELPEFDEEIIDFNYLLYSIKNNNLIRKSKIFSFDNKENQDERFEIQLYNGLNIIFGSKGSGKTNMLNSLHYSYEKEFKYITFSNNGFDNIASIYKKMKKDSLIDSTEKIESLAKLLNKNIKINKIIKNKRNWDFQNILENIRNTLKKQKLDKIKKKNKYMSQKTIDMKLNIDEIFEFNIDVSKNIEKLIQKICNENYKGRIKIKDIKPIFKISIDDTIESIKINHYKLKNNVLKKLSDELKLSDGIKININEKILCLRKNIKFKIDFLKNIFLENEINKNLNKKHILFESEILGPNKKYLLEWKLEKRKNNKTSNDDFHEVISPKKFFEKDDNITRLNKMVLDGKIWELEDFFWNIKTYENDFALKDIFNINLFSKFEKTKNYKPSTGQYDMMKINKLIANNNNMIIDDFCNSLDNEYIYKNLVKKINNFKGIILSSTHNPIISIIPFIQKYIFVKKEGEKYNYYQSNSYIFGEFKINDKKISVKKQLIKTIEGTKEAFDLRRTKYDM